MFVYSLDGLEIDGDLAADVEIEDNEITARSGVYQVLGRLFSLPDEDAYKTSVNGKWPEKLREAGALLNFDFDFGIAALSPSVSAEDYQAEYLRLFEVGTGDGCPASIFGGTYGGGDRRKQMEEVARFFEYFGLKTADDDPRPPDHLAVELNFMQYLAFKEAAAPSPRLGGSYHRAQEDFLDRQLNNWLGEFAAKVAVANSLPVFVWASQAAADFAAADLQYLQA